MRRFAAALLIACLAALPLLFGRRIGDAYRAHTSRNATLFVTQPAAGAHAVALR